MKRFLLTAALLVLGAPQIARADSCDGGYQNIPPVLGIDDNKEYGRIWMNYNPKTDRYCTTMTLRGSREGKPTDGRLVHRVCADGLNSSGNCKGKITQGQQEDWARRSNEFGPIRIPGWNHCIKAVGTLSFTIAGGATRSAYGETPWKCY